MKKVYILLTFLSIIKSHAQVEYLVHVNPVTGLLSIVDSIPGVKTIQIGPSFTTVDNVNNVYYLKGADHANNFSLYGVDGASGKVLTKASFPSTIGAFSNFGSMEHDDSTGTLFCMAWNASKNREYLVKVNKTTAQVTPVSVLYGVKAISMGESTFDQKNGHYYFKGVDSLNAIRIYQVHSATGAILASPLAQNTMKFKYNSVTSKLYAFASASLGMSLVEIDPLTGSIQAAVATYTALTGITAFANYNTISTVNNHLTIKFNSNLATIDLSTGSILSDPPFPIGSTTGTNVIELRYNSNTGVLMGLHFGPPLLNPSSVDELQTNIKLSMDIFPNPVITNAAFRFRTESDMVSICLYNESGKLSFNELLPSNQHYVFQRGNLASGIYYLEVEDRSGNKLVKKLILQ